MLSIVEKGVTDLRKTLTCVGLVLSIAGQGVTATSVAQGAKCETDNQALQAMKKTVVRFTRTDGTEYAIEVKLANNDATRAAGFQRVCASTIAEQPILFLFSANVQPSFHMNNVVAPIDIAFIDDAGVIDSVQAMNVYTLVSRNRPLYRPNKPVIAAFEAHPGFFSEHQIGLSTAVSWPQADDTQSE